jgi:hypothetical protein
MEKERDDYKQIYINNIKKGFELLFEPEEKPRREYIRSILFPLFREVSNIIVEYGGIPLPENSTITEIVYDGVRQIIYNNLKANGYPVLDNSLSNEEKIIMLSDCGYLQLNDAIVFTDIGLYMVINLDENKLMEYGYNKFTIVTFNLYSECPEKSILNYHFIIYNYIEFVKYEVLEDKKFDLDPEIPYISCTFANIYNKFTNKVGEFYIKPVVTFNSVLKNHIYNILKTEFKDISIIKFSFDVHIDTKEEFIVIYLEKKKDEMCLQYTYKTQPLCDYISYLFRIFNVYGPVYTTYIVLPDNYIIHCDSNVLCIYIYDIHIKN